MGVLYRKTEYSGSNNCSHLNVPLGKENYIDRKKNFINCYTTLDDDKGTLVQITLLFSTFSYFVVCLNIIISGLSVISYIGHISYISYIRYQLYQLYQLYQIWNYVISLHRIARKNNQTIHTTITVGRSVQLLHSLCGEERQLPMAA